MSFGRSFALVFLGIALGVGLTIGSYYGVREYAPELAAWYLSKIAGSGEPTAKGLGFEIDPSQVRSIVADILASDQGQAIVSDLMKGQSTELVRDFLNEAMKSPEFRQMISELLVDFLASPEGKELLKRIAKEALMP